jgi:thiol-disulfide isomerase/thioredoxin
MVAVALFAGSARPGGESAQPLAVGARVPEDVRVLPFPPPAAAAEGDAGAADPAVALASLGGDAAKPLVAVFWSTRCPVCRRYAPALRALAKDFEGRARFAVVFPNANETDESIRAFLAEQNVAFASATDRRQEAASRLGVWVTPTVVVLDGAGSLRYRGPVDDDRRRRQRDTTEHLRTALDAVLAGRSVDAAEPRAFGSSVRRRREDNR